MNITWSRMKLQLRHPFQTATVRRADKETLLVRIQHAGLEGFGEASPVDTYGQSPESGEAALARIAPILSGGSLADPMNLEEIMETLLERHGEQRATLAAVDGAIHDWIGKRFEVPTLRWLGLNPARSPLTSLTIGIDSVEMIQQKVLEAGPFPILKLKVGTERDEEHLAIIRKSAPTKTLRVDANTAWSAETAMEKLPMLVRWGVELVEQPVPARDLDGLRRLRGEAMLPIIADESCVAPADVVRLAGCVDGINIKLAKCGGIREAMKMIRLARGLGMRVMLGCMLESSLGISQAAQLAPLADWVDLDGHLLIVDDPFTGIGRGPRLELGERPGLGVRDKSGQPTGSLRSAL